MKLLWRFSPGPGILASATAHGHSLEAYGWVSGSGAVEGMAYGFGGLGFTGSKGEAQMVALGGQEGT